MQGILESIELVKKFKNWQFLITAMFKDIHFDLQKCENPLNEHFSVEDTCMQLCETVEVSITVSSKLPHKLVKGEGFGERSERS